MEALETYQGETVWIADVEAHCICHFWVRAENMFARCKCGWASYGDDTDSLFQEWKKHVEGSMA